MAALNCDEAVTGARREERRGLNRGFLVRGDSGAATRGARRAEEERRRVPQRRRRCCRHASEDDGGGGGCRDGAPTQEVRTSMAVTKKHRDGCSSSAFAVLLQRRRERRTRERERGSATKIEYLRVLEK